MSASSHTIAGCNWVGIYLLTLDSELGTLNLANVQFLNANFCAFVVPRATLKFLVSINIFDMTG